VGSSKNLIDRETISRKDLSKKEFKSKKMFNPKKIPSDIGNYIAGFTDGEGSFNVSFRFREDYQIPWKISLTFNISQKDEVLLRLIKKHFQCGSVRERKSDGVWYYEVNNFDSIQTNVIPFFQRFGFLSAKKKRDFSKFRQIAKLIANGDHLTSEGIKKIVEIRKNMNDGGKRKYSDEEILRILRDYTPNT
jgi:intein-encoded DNA endonuclease-like protein